MKNQKKYQFLKSFINDDKVVEELLDYTKSKFEKTEKSSFIKSDEPYINTWEKYKEESLITGVFQTLKKYIVQFNFPVEQNISSTEIYKNATLRGKKEFPLEGIQLNNPEQLDLTIYNSQLVGKVPVLMVPNPEDFKTIIRAICYKNEPQPMSDSMGAIFIKGINNWNRIEELKEYWKTKSPFENWGSIFKKHVLPNPKLYKDKLIILSTKPYSGVKAKTVNVPENKWNDLSVSIRKEHECAHVFTLNNYNSISKNIYDELIADYAGIVSTLQKFDKNWMLNFLGLENYPKYREGGRFQNYLSDALSATAANHLQYITVRAIDSIAKFDENLGELTSTNDYVSRIKSLCETDLLTMAMDQGEEELLKNYHKQLEEELIQ
ncbi:DUF7005 family protein [Tenacibaculum sp. MEBiC06402]|uniref:DUF7005 family protein n=1 Tax=unclassified Tenacibaculum TaxID=2635139 RepID=UPI003B9C5E1D